MTDDKAHSQKTASPERDIRTAVPGATALKALTHPDRTRMLGILRLEGPQTATALAKRLGLNSGATSYHLRQLAKYGFIEPADDVGNKRERWWRPRHETTRFNPAEFTSEEIEDGLAVMQAVLSQHAELMQRALEQFPQQPREWRKAWDASDFTFTMSAEQALALKEKLATVLWDEMRRAPPPTAPHAPGTKPYTVLVHCFPFPGVSGRGDADGGA